MRRDIVALVASADADLHVLQQAALLAASDGHVTAVLARLQPAVGAAIEGWVVDASWGLALEEARTQQAEELAALQRALAGLSPRISVEGLLADPASLRISAALFGRHSDLVVVGQPTKPGDIRSILIEAALFGAGRPILLTPKGCGATEIGKRALICWNASREAARALGDALDWLADDARITVATVDARPDLAGHGEAPGADIAAHLARRGFAVESLNLASAGRSESDALLDAANSVSADLVVMGGYGRSRFAEMLFGGVTREMLTSANVPVLLSH
jgi:nucleotide-binding universal stress UspA family protein